jgi:TQXA domain-containing protein
MKSMKKITNIIFTLLFAIVFTLTGLASVNAAAQSTTINREGVMVSYIGESYKWAKFRTSDGKVAYCMDVNKKWPEKTTDMTLSKEADNGLRYILANGYPYKSINGNNDVDRFITQAAVWWYLSDTGQTSDKLSDDFTTNSADPYGVRASIKSLVAGAKSAQGTSTPTLSVNVSNTNMSLSSDGQYFVSSEIAPTLSGTSAYNVAVTGAPQGTIVTTTAGVTQTAFKSGEKFLVKIPVNALGQTTTINVNVTAIGATTKAYIYQPADSSYQRVVALYTDNTNLSKTINLTAKLDKPKVCVDYVIVGSVKPDASLTDATPGKSCYDKGTKYNQEHTLTTRQTNCKFNGWYTKDTLTGKWTDGTALDNNMTLYGAWECGSEVTVPNTAANVSLIILGVGLVAIVAGVGIVIYKDKKTNSKSTK